ncbi:hypothetical protein [Leptospira sp. 'Mane']|uniref:hypothetical protein n=1 Tax=Leptospira sp. 'Mane' TaxID=3387407 RepID=UPI00398A5D72
MRTLVLRLTAIFFLLILISCQSLGIKKEPSAYWEPVSQTLGGRTEFSELPGYETSIGEIWSSMHQSYTLPIQGFIQEKKILLQEDTVLYPFSGIDVLNLFTFFPDSKNYVLFGLEDPGFPLNWDKKTSSEKKQILLGNKSLAAHLAGRNYFTYRAMREETKKPALSGALPVFLGFLNRLNKSIIDAEATEINSPKGNWKGFKLTLLDQISGKIQTLTYWKIFLTGNEGEPGDGIYEYFTGLGKIAIFTKSAEYLFHGEKRAKFRDLLLERTNLIVQDDSGFPLRFFPSSDWNKSLYGQYTKSWNLSGAIKPEEQKEILELSQGNQPLPFPFGYGVLGGKEKKQSVLFVIQRK